MTILAGFLLTPIFGLSLLFQEVTPTVGDTIWVRRSVRVPPGQTVRAAEWELPIPSSCSAPRLWW